ncbi:bifunctional diaminohydroxyphosphoribosylaminopyrimidine deaminase/5-amino-6-(5-phosphoribosylamino)uracil reductase RibD [Acetobacterium bakii]|uniref:Riboflavin biosynthesis protein RibD n=1 Tax=Acetobacterium bakii TaxID=52689 RepID=A0A0L6TZU5_9FIRM|nr:bifunctional diaminohydroxyphosphoribosylaminopyrimidine deaminase/5-amino-6-(5-phosphoribosylamino)uracil reductase RibD [Acetobacterium bakii]KNZ41784.1 riboflavin biosynthesis protein RibD [Acetobacterium bakii]
MTDEIFMQMAIDLAQKGCGWVNPNPMVGAFIVKNGKIIGRGYHQKYGELHAERHAIADCRGSTRGATLYVTLEPCCHHGKTPPCTDAIIASGIAKVVIGSIDPNALVAGKGIEILKNHGIEVVTGVLTEQCEKLNEVFFHYITKKTPFVVLKYAMTLDGKIATRIGKSKWITGESAREKVHLSRHRHAGIMVGVNTVIADDPLLTSRLPDTKNPSRIICDTHLRIPIDSKIVKTAREIETYIATSCDDQEKIEPLLAAGCILLQLPKKNGSVNLNELMQRLGEKQLDSILLEGGSTLNFSALENGIVNRVQAYIASKLFGGETAKTPVGGKGISEVNQAFRLKNREITILDDDILIEYDVMGGV